MVASIISRVAIVICGILYPAYSSFKAVRRKSHRDYTKWMMYWIVFALFQAVETVTDTFLPWLPLYYEVKILFVLWLVLPITEGSKQMYRLLVHPFLLRHEERIDKGISQAGQTSLDALKKVSQAGLNKAATTVISSAIMGQNVIAETLLRAQERQANQQRAVTGSDQPDLPQEVSANSSSEHRAPMDFEPFEVIDEEVEALRHPPVPAEGFSRQSSSSSSAPTDDRLKEGEVTHQAHRLTTRTTTTTTTSSDTSKTQQQSASDFMDRAVPEQGEEGLEYHAHQS